MQKELTTLRLFMGVPLTGEATEALAVFANDLKRLSEGSDIRWIPPENYHLTLVFLGSISSTRLDPLKQIMAAAAAGVPPFELVISGLLKLAPHRRNQLLTAAIEENSRLRDLQENLRQDLVAAGFDLEERTFKPHITLARARGGAGFNEEMFDRACRIRVPVKEFCLYSSRTLPEGAVYEVLSEQELTGHGRP